MASGTASGGGDALLPLADKVGAPCEGCELGDSVELGTAASDFEASFTAGVELEQAEVRTTAIAR